MIHLILGRQGSGKTLFLVMKGYEFYKKNQTVYSNIDLKFPYEQLDYNDIVESRLRDGVVLLDEVHLLLPARLAMRRINREICDGFLSQARKTKVDIYGTTQLPRKVDIRFREEADFVYICEKYAHLNKAWVKVLHNQDLPAHIPILINLEVEEMFSGNKVELNFIGNRYFNMFDSRQIIKVRGLNE